MYLEMSYCKALKRLPEKKRNNLLMFYFLDMSDTEIAELQKISRAGAFKNRQNALNKMRELCKRAKRRNEEMENQ